MIRYRVVVSPELHGIFAHFPPSIKQKLHASLRLLELDPRVGKPLQRELFGYWTYPIHPYRIVYRVDGSKRVVRIVIVAHRREVYEILTERFLLRDRPLRRYKITRVKKK